MNSNVVTIFFSRKLTYFSNMTVSVICSIALFSLVSNHQAHAKEFDFNKDVVHHPSLKLDPETGLIKHID
ncbi:hypothetical protein N9W79_01815, partial [bacterium]|nr:hypothetical protein [bacterium]